MSRIGLNNTHNIVNLREEDDIYSCIAEYGFQDEHLNMKEGVTDISSKFGLISIYIDEHVFVFDYNSLNEAQNLDNYLFKIHINNVKQIKFINYFEKNKEEKDDDSKNPRPILSIITTNEIVVFSLEKNIHSKNMINRIAIQEFYDCVNISSYLFYLRDGHIKFINIFDSEGEKDIQLYDKKNGNIEHICGFENRFLCFIQKRYSDFRFFKYDISTSILKSFNLNIPSIFSFCPTIHNNFVLFSYDDKTPKYIIITFIDEQAQSLKSFRFYIKEHNLEKETIKSKFRITSSSHYPLVLFGFSDSKDIYPLYTNSTDEVKILYPSNYIIAPRPRSSSNFEKRLDLDSIQFIECQTADGFYGNYRFLATYGTESFFIYKIQGFEYPNMEEAQPFLTADFDPELDYSDDEIDIEEGALSSIPEHVIQDRFLNMKEGVFDISSLFGLLCIYIETSVYVFDYKTFFDEQDYDKYLFKSEIAKVIELKFINYFDNENNAKARKRESEDEEKDSSEFRPILSVITTEEIIFYSLEKDRETNKILKRIKNEGFTNFTNISSYLFYLSNKEIKFINIAENENQNNNENEEENPFFEEEEEEKEEIKDSDKKEEIENKEQKEEEEEEHHEESRNDKLVIKNNKNVEHICGSDNHILYFIKENSLYSIDLYAKEEKLIKNEILEIFDFCSTINNNLILFSFDNQNDSNLIITFIDTSLQIRKSFLFNIECEIPRGSIKENFHKCSSSRFPIVLFGFSESNDICALYTESIDTVRIVESKEEVISARPRSSLDNSERLELSCIFMIDHRTADDFIKDFSFCATYGSESIFINRISNFDYPNKTKPPLQLIFKFNQERPKPAIVPSLNEDEEEEKNYILQDKEGTYTCESTYAVQDRFLNMKEGVFDISSLFGLLSIYIETSVYVFDYKTFFDEQDYDKYLFKSEIGKVIELKFINYFDNENQTQSENSNSNSNANEEESEEETKEKVSSEFRPILSVITTEEIIFYSLEKDRETNKILKRIKNEGFTNFTNISSYLFYLTKDEEIGFTNVKSALNINSNDKEEKELVINHHGGVKHICGCNNRILYLIERNILYSIDVVTKEEKLIKARLPEIFDLCSTVNNNLVLFGLNMEKKKYLIVTYVDANAKVRKSFQYYLSGLEIEKEEEVVKRFRKSSSDKLPLVLFGFDNLIDIFALYTESIDKVCILNSKEEQLSPRPRSSKDNKIRLELNSITIIDHRSNDGIIQDYSFCTTYGTESLFIFKLNNFEYVNKKRAKTNICIPFERPNNKRTTQYNENEEDMGGFEEDMGGFEEDMGGFEEDMGGFEEDMEGFEEEINEDEIHNLLEQKSSFTCNQDHFIQNRFLNMKEGVFDVSSLFGLLSIYIDDFVYVFDYKAFFEEQNLDNYLFKCQLYNVIELKFINYYEEQANEEGFNDFRPILSVITDNEIIFYLLEWYRDDVYCILSVDNEGYTNFTNVSSYLFYLHDKEIKFINTKDIKIDNYKEEEEEEEHHEESRNDKLVIKNNKNVEHICGSDNHILYFIKENSLYSIDLYAKEEKLIKNEILEIFDFCSTINNNLILFSFDNQNDSNLIITFIDASLQRRKSYRYNLKCNFPKNRLNKAFHKCSSSRFPIVLFGFSESNDICALYTESIDTVRIVESKEEVISARPRSSLDNSERLELSCIFMIDHRTADDFIKDFSFCTTYGSESIFINRISNFDYPNKTKPPFVTYIEFEGEKQAGVPSLKEEEDVKDDEEEEVNIEINKEEEKIYKLEDKEGTYTCESTYAVQDRFLNMKEGVFDISSLFGLLSIYIETSVYVFDYKTFFDEQDYDKYLFKSEIGKVIELKFINYFDNENQTQSENSNSNANANEEESEEETKEKVSSEFRPILSVITTEEIIFYSLEKDRETNKILKRIKNEGFTNFTNISSYLFYLSNKEIKFVNISENEKQNKNENEEENTFFEEEEDNNNNSNKELVIKHGKCVEHICGCNNRVLYFYKRMMLYSIDVVTKEEKLIKARLPEIFDLCATVNNNLVLFSIKKKKYLIVTYVDANAKVRKSFQYYLSGLEIEKEEEVVKRFRKSSSDELPLVLFGFDNLIDIFALYTESIDKVCILNSKEEQLSPRPRSSKDNKIRLELNSITIIDHRSNDGVIQDYSFCTTYGTESLFIFKLNNFEYVNKKRAKTNICIPFERPNNKRTTQYNENEEDMGGFEEDMGGFEEDMGGFEEDMGGFEEDMGGFEKDNVIIETKEEKERRELFEMYENLQHQILMLENSNDKLVKKGIKDSKIAGFYMNDVAFTAKDLDAKRAQIEDLKKMCQNLENILDQIANVELNKEEIEELKQMCKEFGQMFDQITNKILNVEQTTKLKRLCQNMETMLDQASNIKLKREPIEELKQLCQDVEIMFDQIDIEQPPEPSPPPQPVLLPMTKGQLEIKPRTRQRPTKPK
ncbi:hypothetical protein M9Y10_046086 [Tritrichomonas musculus]|uniref:Cleavage/polyadenylation specificity factor A subunit C-terminal domain-containing protein n=1 Tax=Tritrichomonas musculus TaxID=1915356 RepID=A0ABR2JX43_9EUKA